MCMCVGGELVEWVVDESACLRLWCDASLARFFNAFFDASMLNECLSSEGASLIVRRSLRGEVFNYLFVLLPGQLDGE